MIDLKVADAEGMSWLQFWASVIRSVAWPAAASVIAFIFRGPIRGLLGKVRKLTWGDKSVDFAEKLDELEAAPLKQPAQRPDPAKRRLSPGEEEFERLLVISPAAAILHSWVPTEMLFQELTEDEGDELFPRKIRSTAQNIEVLLRKGLITDTIAHQARELLNLRNAAAHGASLTAADAYRFRSTTDTMIDAIERRLKEVAS